MKHQFTITVDTEDESLAFRVYEEVSGAIGDFRESRRPACDIDSGTLHTIESELDKLYIAKARDLNTSEDLAIYDDAVVSEADGGAWVESWVWVTEDDTIRTVTNVLDAQGDSSEGGHCD